MCIITPLHLSTVSKYFDLTVKRLFKSCKSQKTHQVLTVMSERTEILPIEISRGTK